MENDIPLSHLEKVNNLEIELKLHNQMKLFIFFSLIMGNDKKFEMKEFKEYKSKITKVSRKIDRWHKMVTMDI